MTHLQFCTVPSPVGTLLLCADKDSLRTVCWQSDEFRAAEHTHWREEKPLYFGHTQDTKSIIHRTVVQLREYFEGARQQFDIPLHHEGTPFQQEVWHALGGIPYGQTMSYEGLANVLSNPKGARAVGGACGANALSILTPCHRVIGSDGGMGGFGGGAERKKTLLELESATSRP